MSETVTGRARTTGRAWQAALFIGAFAVSTTEFVPVGLLPQIASDTGVSESVAGQLVTVNALAFALGTPILGVAFARLDRRRVLAGALVCFAIGHLLGGLAPNFGVLLASRLITGAMMGLYLATAIALAAHLAEPDRRARAMALVVAGVSTATALGVPLSTQLGRTTGWRLSFVLIGGLALLSVVMVTALVPAGRARVRPGGAAGLGDPAGADRAAEVSGFAGRLAGLRSRPVLLGLAAIVVFWAASFSVYTYLVRLLEDRAGLHGTPVVAVLFLAGLGAVGGNLLGGRGADARLRATLGGTAAVTALALLALIPGAGHSGIAVTLVAVWQLAAWSFVPAVQATVYRVAGSSGDLAVSLAVSAFNIGIVAGAGIGGVVLQSYGIGAVPLVGGALGLVALVLVGFLVSDPRLRAATTPDPLPQKGDPASCRMV